MQQQNNSEMEVELAEESFQINDIEMECANQADLGYKQQLIKQVASAALSSAPALASKALRWHMPIIGEIPMSKLILKSSFTFFIFSVFHSRMRQDF